MKKLIPTLAVLVLVIAGAYAHRREPVPHGQSAVAAAYERHLSHVRVEDRGSVVAILPDDEEGSRHQRFLVRASDGTTVLIAHNIDLAQRVAPLHRGDLVAFSGEYIWNAKGGVVHWTHRDPAGHHAAGWIRVNGRTFQ